jgi:hypothetical protein
MSGFISVKNRSTRPMRRRTELIFQVLTVMGKVGLRQGLTLPA